MAFSLTGKLPLGKLSFQKMYIWEITALEIAHLGSCHLGKYPLEVPSIFSVCALNRSV